MRSVLLAAACFGGLLGPGCATPPAQQDPGARASPQLAGPERAIAAARADAARRTGQSAETLELVSAQAVTWRDGSLGCPQPGMLYTQALVPGYRIVLRTRQGTLDYHANMRGAVVLCPPERAEKPLPGAARM